MGSGVMPLAMATRPSKAARDPAIPDVSPGERLVERGPGLDPGPSPAGLVGGKRVVCRCRSEGKGLPPWFSAQPGLRLKPRRNQGSAGDDLCRWAWAREADRAISTGQLRGLPRFHLRPIDVMVSHGSRRDLVLRGVSRLDAFSGYPVRT